jgi:hypothetical protein
MAERLLNTVGEDAVADEHVGGALHRVA